jgi:hypothetical protein
VSRTALIGGLVAGGVLLSACGSSTPDDAVRASADTIEHTELTFVRADDVPDLPFDDNPDPDQCGIPVRWGKDDPAWLTGMWEGELIQPSVHLYDSHLRLEVRGRLDHGSEVRIVLFQENPVLDYYLVESPDGAVEGWVPEHFLSFERVTT